MQPHMPAVSGPHFQPHPQMNGHSRRHQEYHTYHGHQPQSPMHQGPYQSYPYQPQHYFPPQPSGPFPQPPPWARQPYSPYPVMRPQLTPVYPPRSPVVVTSQPSPHTSTPVTQHTPNGYAPRMHQDVNGVHNLSPHMQPHRQPQPPQAPPSPAPTPKQESEQRSPPAPAPVQMEVQRREPPQPQEQAVEDTTITETPAPPSRRQSRAQSPLSMPPQHRTPFYPKLPWLSQPDQAFPRRTIARRRRRQNLQKSSDAVALPYMQPAVDDEKQEQADEAQSEASTVAAPSEQETPATSQAPSESEFTQVSTPNTPAQASAPSPKPTPTQTHARRDTRTAIAVPNIPGLPKPKASPPAAEKKDTPHTPATDATTPTPENQGATQAPEEQAADQEKEGPKTSPPKPAAPKSWADLVRTKAGPAAVNAQTAGSVATNGVPVLPKNASLAEVLRQYSVQNASIPFLEPRGLVNTGNMCYMNSILQVLVFCAPFYNYLEQVRQRTVHSMKSDTPLIDATIMFMREFKVLASAESVDVLRKALKAEQLEQFGEPVTPEYVYEAIRKLPRFNSMRRGHQQDAEEFFGFLLEGLHDECVAVMEGAVGGEQTQENGVTSPSTVTASPNSADGWLEVGPKQKAAVTRTAGQQDAPSPITKIFGGHLRSELRVPGLKDSVTLEPYKPLQLDIGAQHVNNIVDALKGLTRTEVMEGDFGGRGTSAKKQVFIDSLPPVLILHLKRFEYTNNLTGTQKIWKKVGYPLELEIPKEVFPPAKRGGFAVKGGLPKYRLISVVYHHGKSAAGGHYTVDVLRQDGREWVRMDDTVIRRIRPDDVAEGGAEEDPKLLAKALEQHKADQELQKQRNIYQGLDEAEREPEEEKPWSEVNGNPAGKKNWSAVATTNGTATPSSTTGKRTPTARKEGVRDNKVAYILLYERING